LSSKKKKDDEELDEDEHLEDGEDSTQTEMTNPNFDKTESEIEDDEAEEDEEDEQQSKSIIAKLKKKFAKKKSSNEEEDDDDDEEKPKKRKVSPIAIIVVIGLIIFMFAPDSENPEVVEEVPLKTPAYKKNLPPKTDPAPTVEPEAPTVEPEAPTVEPEAPTVEPEAPTVEPEAPAVEPEAPTVEPEAPTVEPEAPAVEPEAPAVEPEQPTIEDDDIDLSGLNSGAGEDSIDGTFDEPQADMTDQILRDLESQVKKDQPKTEVRSYVSPPDYEYRGRGLVYNCGGKHWACVDGPSYKNCEDNHAFQDKKNAKIECYPFNVYETTRGCELMQNRLVSSGAKTEFCKN